MAIKDNTCNHLLVYGTLLAAGNTYANFLLRNSMPAGEGWFPGKLYDIDEYPGAVFDVDSSTKIYGHIMLMTDAVKVLRVLDEYEGFGPDEEQPNLFLRELTEIETETGDRILCWVYFFNRPVDGYRLITSGRYRRDA